MKFEQPITLTYKELLEEKLASRTKEDLTRLKQQIDNFIQIVQQEKQTECNVSPQDLKENCTKSHDAVKTQNLQLLMQQTLKSSKFPCHFLTCGHVDDFIEVLDRFSSSKQWSCQFCSNIERSLRGIKVFKQSDVFEYCKDSNTKKQLKVEKFFKPETQTFDMSKIIQDLEAKINKLSLMDIDESNCSSKSTQDQRRNYDSNYYIENLFNAVSLNQRDKSIDLKSLQKFSVQYSPLQKYQNQNNHLQEKRSEVTKSTASSHNSKNTDSIFIQRFKDHSFQKKLQFNQHSVMLTPSLLPSKPNLDQDLTNTQDYVLGSTRKSEQKRNWKLNQLNGNDQLSQNKEKDLENEFKIPSPRRHNKQHDIQNQGSNVSESHNQSSLQQYSSHQSKQNQNKKRNRSQVRDYKKEANPAPESTQSNQNSEIDGQFTLKKRPLSSQKEDSLELHNLNKHASNSFNTKRLNLNSSYQNQSQSDNFTQPLSNQRCNQVPFNTYKRQRFQ
eukprot:403372206